MRRVLVAISMGLIGCVVALAPASRAGAAAERTVTISTDCGGPDFCFTPATLTISDGDTVTWSNQSSGALHLVGRCDPDACDGVDGGSGSDAGFGTADVPEGGTFSYTFRGAGTYTYFCAIHGYSAMHGVIVVNAAPPPTTATTSAPSTTAAGVTTAPGATSPPGATGGSTPVSVAATAPGSASGDRLASTGDATGGALTVGIGALVLGLAAWGVCTPRRGVVPRLRR